MIAAIRTIPIDRQVPMPKWKAKEIRATFKAMRKGDSFLWENYARRHFLYRLAAECGAKIVTLKINGQGCRVWRVK